MFSITARRNVSPTVNIGSLLDVSIPLLDIISQGCGLQQAQLFICIGVSSELGQCDSTV